MRSRAPRGRYPGSGAAGVIGGSVGGREVESIRYMNDHKLLDWLTQRDPDRTATSACFAEATLRPHWLFPFWFVKRPAHPSTAQHGGKPEPPPPLESRQTLKFVGRNAKLRVAAQGGPFSQPPRPYAPLRSRVAVGHAVGPVAARTARAAQGQGRARTAGGGRHRRGGCSEGGRSGQIVHRPERRRGRARGSSQGRAQPAAPPSLRSHAQRPRTCKYSRGRRATAGVHLARALPLRGRRLGDMHHAQARGIHY